MAETLLFKSFRETENRKASLALDDALERAETAANAPQPPQDPMRDQFDPAVLQSRVTREQPATGEPQEPGVLGSLKRGVGAVKQRFMEGIDQLGGAIEPVTTEETRDLPVDASMLQKVFANRRVRGVLGALEVVFPFGAFAGSTYGDFIDWLNTISPPTDDFVRAQLALAKQHSPGTVPMWESLLAIPQEERITRAREGASLAADVVASFIPGYTGIARGVKLLSRAGKAAGAAEAVTGPRALLERNPLHPEEAGRAIPAPGEVTPSAQDRLVSALVKPEHRLTMTEIAQQALDERRALEAESAARLGQPGAERVAGAEGRRELLREQGRTPLSADDGPAKFMQDAEAVAKQTVTDGGATFDPRTGGFYTEPRGYAVGAMPERGVKIAGRPATGQDVADFIEKNWDVFSVDTKAHVGTWISDGTTHLDVTRVVDDLDEALRIGTDAKQEAVWDFANSTEIPVGKQLQLEHYSAQRGLTEVDPEKFGTGQAGRERERASEAGFIKRSYHYVAGTTPEARFEKLPKYTGSVAESKILDLASDRGKELVAAAGNDATKLENAVKDAGYLGYRDSSLNLPGNTAKYANTPGNVVALFSPLKVKAFRTAGGAAAGAAADVAAGDDQWNGTMLGAGIAGNLKLLRLLKTGARDLTLTGRMGNALATRAAAKLLVHGADTAVFERELVKEFGPGVTPHLPVLYERGAKTLESQVDGVLRRGMLSKFEELGILYDAVKDGAVPGAADWYGTPEMLRNLVGPDAKLMAGLLAATAPQQNAAKANIDAALGVYKILKTKSEDKWFKLISKDNRKLTPLFGISGENAVPNVQRAIDGARIERGQRPLWPGLKPEEGLSGNKVNDFFHALIGDEAAFPIDRHMVPILAPDLKAPRGEKAVALTDAVYDGLSEWGKAFASAVGAPPRYVQQRLWVNYRVLAGIDARVGGGNEVFYKTLTERAAETGILDLMPASKFVTPAARALIGATVALDAATSAAAQADVEGGDAEGMAYAGLLSLGLGSLAAGRHAPDILRMLRTPALKTIAREAARRLQAPDLPGAPTEFLGGLPTRPPRSLGQQIREQRRMLGREPMPNTERMGTTPGSGAKALVRDISSRLAGLRKLTRSDVVSHEETIAAAASSRFHENIDEILKLEEKSVVGAADGLAIRDTRDAMLEDWLRVATEAEQSGDPAMRKQAFERYLLTSEVVGKEINVSSEGARAVEAHKIVTKPARAGRLDYDAVAEQMDELRRGLAGVQVTEDNIVQVARELRDRGRVAKLMADAKKVPSAWWKIYYGLNLLSTPLFHPKNVIGNSSALVLSLGARGVGEVISYPFWLAGKREFRGKPLIAPGETYDLLVGGIESIKDAWTAGKRTMSTGESLFRSPSKYAERMDLVAAQRALQEPGGLVQVMVDSAARLAEKNLRFAASTDEFYKVLEFAGEQRALARRAAWTSGKRTWGETVAEQARLLDDTPREIIAGAEDFAEYNTFTKAFDRDRFWGRLAGSVEDVAAHPAMRLTLTQFFRTPMRIAEYGSEYTPVLNFVAPTILRQAMSGGANAQLAISKIALSWGMTTVLASYAAAGFITGDWSHDPALRARQKEAGFKPFSLYVPVVDKYVSYNGLGPIVAPIAAVATYAQMGPHLKDDGVATAFTAIALASLKTNLAQPYFDSLNDFVQIFESYDDAGAVEKTMKFIADRLRTFVPAAGLLRSVATSLDGEVKDLKEFGNQFDPAWRDVFNLLASTAVSLPGFSRAVPAYRNIVTGEPIPLEGGPLPGMISTPTKDPVLVEILELGGAGLPKEIPRFISGAGKDTTTTFRVYAPDDGAIAPLTHAQRTRLADLLTKVVEVDGRTLHEALEDMIVGPGDAHETYAEQSDGKRGGKALLIHQLWNAYYEEAEQRLLDENPDLQESLRQAQIARASRLVPESRRQEFMQEMTR